MKNNFMISVITPFTEATSIYNNFFGYPKELYAFEERISRSEYRVDYCK